LSGDDGMDYVSGNRGDDDISGNDGWDLLLGDKGSDTMSGGSGIDLMLGGEDKDYMNGNAGIDFMLGCNGDDCMWGGNGSDLMWGNLGNDFLKGGNGLLDNLHGDNGGLDFFPGIDQILDFFSLSGVDGNDEIYGGAGIDWIYGNGGDDILDGGKLVDLIYGGPGDDKGFGGEHSAVISGDVENRYWFDSYSAQPPSACESHPFNNNNGDDEDCSCGTTVSVNYQINWNDLNGVHLQQYKCNNDASELLNLSDVCANQPISVSNISGFYCTPISCTPTYSMQVTDPNNQPMPVNSMNMSFLPTITGEYKIVIRAHCEGSICGECKVKIYIKNFFDCQ